MRIMKTIRWALIVSAPLALSLSLPGCSEPKAVAEPSPAAAVGKAHDGMKMLVLGMDGMDPVLLQKYMDEGKLPNFKKVAEMGTFMPLATAMPPQSPVAWSNFISGADPGTHQIYDFIHRELNPKNEGLPIDAYLSTSKIEAPEHPKFIPWGKDWAIPLSGGKTVSYRKGDAFWDYLVQNNIDTTIYRVPANYPPPVEVKGRGLFRCLCGMGTPDLMGSYGEFTAFKENTRTRTVGGGRFVRIEVDNHHVVCKLEGPPNYLRRMKDEKTPPPPLTADIDVTRDPEEEACTIVVGDTTILLKKGEWSDWLQVNFDTGVPWSSMVSTAFPTSLPGIIRFYLKDVHPQLNLYVSPVNIDPTNAINPISTPIDFATKIANDDGLFYTTGIPEDTKALRERALNEDEFLQMVKLLAAERMRQWKRAIDHFDHGFLFYYFGHTDQLAHIFWRDIDPGHPGRKPEQDGKYDKVIEDTYIEMDGVVGDALAKIDSDDVLIIMSDHGFASFRRGMNLNTWLMDNDYLAIRSEAKEARGSFANIDFGNSEAYALGLNCFYINLKGRERAGIVEPARKRELMNEIAAKLLEVRDDDGTKVIDKVYIVDDLYPHADPLIAPDMLIGFARNYRGSWANGLGGQPEEVFEDNMDRWSGDHCIAAHLVPGILVTNRKVSVSDPALTDMAPTILKEFGVEPPKSMIGRDVFAPAAPK